MLCEAPEVQGQVPASPGSEAGEIAFYKRFKGATVYSPIVWAIIGSFGAAFM